MEKISCLSFGSNAPLELKKVEKVQISKDIGADERFAYLFFATVPVPGGRWEETWDREIIRFRCEDRGLYGRLIEGHQYTLFGRVNFSFGRYELLVSNIVGEEDGLEVDDPRSVYFHNLDPFEIGDFDGQHPPFPASSDGDNQKK
jgi:hypothetical protein